jgi:Zn-finger domain-containing protein
MKFKHLLITILLVFTLLKSFADPIDEATAKRVALNFLKSKTNSITLPNTTSLDLVYKDDFDHITCYYVFNTNNLGFIIISGDDVVLPVLGYSDESNFEINGMPIQVRKWLEGYQKQIVFAVKNRLKQMGSIEK